MTGTPAGPDRAAESASSTALSLNGANISVALAPDTPLLWVLRDAANLTGAKAGCVDGQCGSCLVLVDDAPTAACGVPLAAVAGRRVVTIEGLGTDALRPIRTAFADEAAVLCGHCTPAMLIAGHALLRVDAAPGDDAIDAAMTPLCRCGAYGRIRAAVRRAGIAMRQRDNG